jgi:hypothetical protein
MQSEGSELKFLRVRGRPVGSHSAPGCLKDQGHPSASSQLMYTTTCSQQQLHLEFVVFVFVFFVYVSLVLHQQRLQCLHLDPKLGGSPNWL